MAVRKVAVTLPEELFDMVERLRQTSTGSRSEVFQGARRRHSREPVYQPTEKERRLFDEPLDELDTDESVGRSWGSVRAEVWPV